MSKPSGQQVMSRKLTFTLRPAHSSEGSMFFSRLSLPLYKPSGKEEFISSEGCRWCGATRFRGRLGKPTQTALDRIRVSETPLGKGGSGLSFDPLLDRPVVLLEGLLPRIEGVLFTTRCKSRLFGA